MLRTKPYKKGDVIYEKIYEATLYPDSTSYDVNDIIAYVQSQYPYWAYILHDQDVNEDGEIKKAHYHVLFKNDNRLSIESVAKHLGISVNALEWKSDWVYSVQYLVHWNHPKKFQYDIKDIQSCYADIESEFFKDKKVTETEQASLLFDFIEKNQISKMSVLVAYAIENNLYSTLRRSATIFNQMLKDNR